MRGSRGFLSSSFVMPLLVLTMVGTTAGTTVAAERNVLGEYFTATW